MNKQKNSSWESVAKWYDESVGEKGHYFHTKVILPKLLEMMHLKDFTNPKILDLACGQAAFARHLPSSVSYVGLDLSSTLIHAAKTRKTEKKQKFLQADITQKLPLEEKDFTHATIILALQNIEDFQAVFKNAYFHLIPLGEFFIVLNHPCFRIPRQSSWEKDLEKKIQYRRIDRYMETLKIPISMHPGKAEKEHTWSFHFPLAYYFHGLKEAGFVITDIEEWISDKKSLGKAARMENRARKEFPLFLTLAAQKLR